MIILSLPDSRDCRPVGGTGRRIRLKPGFLTEWGFESLMGHYPVDAFHARFERFSSDILPTVKPGFFLPSLTGATDSSRPGVGRRKKKRLHIIVDGRFENR